MCDICPLASSWWNFLTKVCVCGFGNKVSPMMLHPLLCKYRSEVSTLMLVGTGGVVLFGTISLALYLVNLYVFHIWMLAIMMRPSTIIWKLEIWDIKMNTAWKCWNFRSSDGQHGILALFCFHFWDSCKNKLQ